jgi:uncharacterized membrane protein HdeD (DUF308 family)
MLKTLQIICVLLGLALLVPGAAANEDEFSYENAQTKSVELRAQEPPPDKLLDQLVIEYRNKEREANQRSFLVVTGAMIVALLLALIAIHKSGNRSAEPVVMTSGLILIVYGALAVTLVATTHEQLTTPIGVLGAMAGYLFGRSSLRRGEGAKSDDAPARPGG